MDDAVELPTTPINTAPTLEYGSFHNEKQVFNSGQQRVASFWAWTYLFSWLLLLQLVGPVNMARPLGVFQPPSGTDHMGPLPLIADLQPAGPPYPASQGSGLPVPLPNPGHQQRGRKSPKERGVVSVKPQLT